MLFRGGRFPRVGQMRSLLGTASHIVRFGFGTKRGPSKHNGGQGKHNGGPRQA